jgi:hypothetical protein
MCCFSRKVDAVNDTNIFARASKDGKQFLVYSMKYRAADDLSMILPIPTDPEAGEKAVSFINLEKYEDFFVDLHKGFPPPKGEHSDTRGKPNSLGKLEVFEVGSFVASFVPTVKDFSRLDEQFRLPAQVWDRLPQYKDFGFAVFKLKKGAQKVHPMAFEFARANPNHLFFPTVHIHDGTVKPRARFHHVLFCQGSGNEELKEWTESAQPAGMFVKADQSMGIIDPDAHAYRKVIAGVHPNKDILV